MKEFDTATALQLCRMTSDFYKTNAESFSETRSAPWAGWTRLLEEVAPALQQNSLHILDVACGNMRFGRFLADQLPQAAIDYHAVDNCKDLAPVKIGNRLAVDFQLLDIVPALANGNFADELAVFDKSCDLTVAFGFMHHIPLAAWREDFLRQLVAKVRPGGYLAVSCWRFMNSPKLATKAQETTARAIAEFAHSECSEFSQLSELPKNDYLLGWQQTQGSYRYCHHFDEAELQALEQALIEKARLVVRYQADGKTGNLNEYFIWQVI